MSIRAAIIAAATHIRQHPTDYCFLSTCRPRPNDRAGCALGWIGYYACVSGREKAIEEPFTYLGAVTDLIGVSAFEFYDRLDSYSESAATYGRGPWTMNAEYCARALLLYAEEFHPEESS